MLFNFIVNAIVSLVTAILSVLPTAPATPTVIVNAGQWTIDTINGVISVLRMIYGGTLLDAIIVVIVALFTFDKVYHATMWILRKIPGLNIK